MASLALHLKSHPLKPSPSLFPLSRPFSSSSSNNNNDDKPNPFSSYFSDIKSKLQQHQQQPPGFRQQQHQQQNSNDGNAVSFDQVRKNLSDFRRRSAVPHPDFANQQKTNTTPFQNFNSRNPNVSGDAKAAHLSFDKIRESLRLIKGRAAAESEGGSSVKEKMSLNTYRQSFKMQPPTPGTGIGGVRKVIGGSVADLPANVFGKELKEKEMREGRGGDASGESEDDVSKFDLVRIYSHDELGKKLRELRPEMNKGKKKEQEEGWFSISELGERLKKLKVIEEKTPGGEMFAELRKGLSAIKESDKEKDKPKNVSCECFLKFTFFDEFGFLFVCDCDFRVECFA